MSHVAQKNQTQNVGNAVANNVSRKGMSIKPPVQKKEMHPDDTMSASIIDYDSVISNSTTPFRPTIQKKENADDQTAIKAFSGNKTSAGQNVAQLRTIALNDGRQITTENFTEAGLQAVFEQIIATDLAGGQAIDAAIDAGEYINGRVILDDTPFDDQETPMSCWYAALSMVLGFHNVGIPNYTHHEAYTRGLLPEEIDGVMTKCNLGMRVMARDISETADLGSVLNNYGPMMCINIGAQHCIVIYGVAGDTVYYYDPAAGAATCTLSQAIAAYALYLQYNRANDYSALDSSDDEAGSDDGKS